MLWYCNHILVQSEQNFKVSENTDVDIDLVKVQILLSTQSHVQFIFRD